MEFLYAIEGAEMNSARVVIKLKNRRRYVLQFKEKDQTMIQGIGKNLKAFHELFTQPKYFFAFEIFPKLAPIEQKHKGWEIYDILEDFKLQGLNLQEPKVYWF